MPTDRYAIDSHKLHLHPSRVAQWLDAGDDWERLKSVYPVYAEVSPVGHCNHRCSFCAVDYIGYKPRQLALDVMDRCFLDMSVGGVQSIMFAGEGEPLLHKDFAGLVRSATDYRIDVAITTNATQLTTAMADACLGRVTWLKASVNAGTEAAYNTIHRAKPGDWRAVWDGLWIAAMTRFAGKLPVTLGVQSVLLPENADTMPALCKRARDTGLDYVVIKPYSQQPLSTATAERYGSLSYGDQSALADVLAAYNTDSFKVVFRSETMAQVESERPYQTCHSTPNFWAYIMADGSVYGCGAHLLDDRFCFGNINEQSFKDIWEGERRRKCLEMMGAFDIGTCRKSCRMEHANRFLDRLKNPQGHDNFI